MKKLPRAAAQELRADRRPDAGRDRQGPADVLRGGLRRRDDDEPLPQDRASGCWPSKKRGGVVPVVSTSTEVRAPKGVIGLISPWNFPFATSLSDTMPALIAGNGVVLKPDNKSTLNVAYGVSLLYEAGLPAGLVQIVCGEGPDVGPALVDGADFVMFTGSTATGRFVGERAGANLIDCTLELGGKNPLIVMPDADLDEVVPGRAVRRVPQRRPGLHAHRADLRAAGARGGVHPPVRDRRRADQARCDVRLGARRWAASSPPTTSSGSPTTSRTRGRRAPRCSTGGRARPDLGPTFYEPTVLRGVTKEMKHGDRGDLRAGDHDLHLRRPSTRPWRWPTTPTYGLNASVWSTDLDGRRGGRAVGSRRATSTSTTASPRRTPARRRRRAG